MAANINKNGRVASSFIMQIRITITDRKRNFENLRISVVARDRGAVIGRFLVGVAGARLVFPIASLFVSIRFFCSLVRSGLFLSSLGFIFIPLLHC